MLLPIKLKLLSLFLVTGFCSANTHQDSYQKAYHSLSQAEKVYISKTTLTTAPEIASFALWCAGLFYSINMVKLVFGDQSPEAIQGSFISLAAFSLSNLAELFVNHAICHALDRATLARINCKQCIIEEAQKPRRTFLQDPRLLSGSTITALFAQCHKLCEKHKTQNNIT